MNHPLRWQDIECEALDFEWPRWTRKNCSRCGQQIIRSCEGGILGQWLNDGTSYVGEEHFFRCPGAADRIERQGGSGSEL
jgi:hypothetical protein